RVLDGATGHESLGFYAYDSTFPGGVFVATGDLDGDGVAEIVTGAGEGGGPHVRIFNGRTGAIVGQFFAYDQAFTGGVHVAVGDVTGDGQADIVTGAGAGGSAHVRIFNGRSLQLENEFTAYPETFTGGVYVAVADVNGDGRPDIITGTGPGGAPHVKVFNGADLSQLLMSFFAYD